MIGTNRAAVADDRTISDGVAPHLHGRDSDTGGNAESFDRIVPPDPMRPRRGDALGKRALYSVDPEANPAPLLIVSCERCGVERGLTATHLLRLLRPPWLLNPCRRTLWARCPTCQRRSWLQVRLGPGIPWPFRPARS